MKKSLVFLLALTLAGAVVFAEDAKLTVGAWGRSAFVPYDSDNNGEVYGYPNNWHDWWANGGNVGVGFYGSSDNVGFALDVDYNGGTIGFGDQAKIWVKPASFLKVQVGQIEGDALRGKIGDYGTYIVSNGDEDLIFTRFYPKQGILLDITPVDNLYIGASIDSTVDTASNAGIAYKNAQFGAGYTIDKVGQIRAQYIGSGEKVQFAFAYTGTAGLVVDLGAQYAIANSAFNAIIAATYGTDAFSAKARVSLATDHTISATAEGAYTIASPVSAGLDVGYNTTPATGVTNIVEIAPFAKFSYGNGYLKAGVTVTDNINGITVKVPVQLEYWF